MYLGIARVNESLHSLSTLSQETIPGQFSCNSRKCCGILIIFRRNVSKKVKRSKVKFSHTRYRALGPELIPVYRQSAFDGLQESRGHQKVVYYRGN